MDQGNEAPYPDEWDDEKYDAITPGEMRRRLDVMDSRLEGIRTDTKAAAAFLLFIMLGVWAIVFAVSGWF